jgi:hypothetical protein
LILSVLLFKSSRGRESAFMRFWTEKSKMKCDWKWNEVGRMWIYRVFDLARFAWVQFSCLAIREYSWISEWRTDFVLLFFNY